MKSMNLKEMDSESVSITGFYVGAIGTGLSLAGVLLSVYSLAAGEKAIWLGISGWVAAIVCAWALVKLCTHLIKINTEIRNNLIDATNKNTLLSEKNEQLKATNEKILEIDAYVISKTVRKPSPRKEKDNTPQPRPADVLEDDTIEGDA